MFKTRIAPSPTGDMHLGTARTAYFNWLAARASGGKFILRIDDTDAARNSQQSADDIYTIMDWLGLNYDYSFRQYDSIAFYEWWAYDLVKQGFGAFDGKAIRLALPPSFDVHIGESWVDDIAGAIQVTQSDFDQTKNLVLMKSDGTPTYNWASVVDDIVHGINFVIRGTDHIKNTSKQFFLYKVLDKELPRYAHVGLLTDMNGKKLSKREGAASMLAYRNDGYDPDAVLNFMLRLGWGPKVDDKSTKIITRDRALELFLDGGKMKSSAAKVDVEKLKSFDRKYKGRKKNGQL